MKVLFAAALLLPVIACAQSTPVGLWKTIDDDGKTAKSLVRISEQGGTLVGNIDKLLDPTAATDSKCDKCLQIIRGVKAEGDGVWGGGEILDPNNGKTYRTRLKPVDGGKKLEMRGYIGPFYRSQLWQRVE
jgi:uncharacterized protein (DUF2147 family)